MHSQYRNLMVIAHEGFGARPRRHFIRPHGFAVRTGRCVDQHMDVARIGDVFLVVVDPGMNKLWLVLNNGEYAKISVIAVSNQSDNSLVREWRMANTLSLSRMTDKLGLLYAGLGSAESIAASRC